MFLDWIDLIVGAVILLSAYFSTERGGMREFLTLAVWVLSAGVSLLFAPMLRPVISMIPYVEGIMESCILSLMTSFCILFGVWMVLFSFVVSIRGGTYATGGIGKQIDYVLGFCFGVLRAIFLIGIAYGVYSELIPEEDLNPRIENSKTAALIRKSADMVFAVFPTNIPGWLESRVTWMVDSCHDEQKALKEKKLDNTEDDKLGDILSEDDSSDVYLWLGYHQIEQDKLLIIM